MCFTRSSFVTWPPRPVPATCVASSLFSSATRRPAGDSSAFGAALLLFWEGVGGAEAPIGAPPGAGEGAADGLAGAAATAPSSITASSSWLVTVSPDWRRISLITPSTGEGTSSTTLSVSRSTRFSSRLTASPAFLCQLAMVASETDSGRTGTLTSMGTGTSSMISTYSLAWSPLSFAASACSTSAACSTTCVW